MIAETVILNKLDQIESTMLAELSKLRSDIGLFAGLDSAISSVSSVVNETALGVTEINDSENERKFEGVFKKHQIGNASRHAATIRALRTLATGDYGRSMTPDEVDRFLSVHPDFAQVCRHSLFGERKSKSGFPWSLGAVAYATHYTGKFVMFEQFLDMFDGNGANAAADLRRYCEGNRSFANRHSVIVLHCAGAFWAAHSGAPFDPDVVGKIFGWDEAAFLNGTV